MDANKLVRMANQIAANLDYGPEPDKAVAGVLDHIQRFWGMPMKRDIVAFYRSGQPGLSDVARGAVAQLAEETDDAA